MDWFEVMKIALVAAGVYMSVTQGYQSYKLIKYKYPSGWTHAGLSIMGLYWSWYYLRSILDIPLGHGHQVYVRSAILLTVMLAGAAGAFAIRRIRP